MAFIFNGNTGETPETLRRKRSLAEALAVKTSSAPRNVGEGLNAIGNALIYRALMGKVDAGDAEGKKALEADRAAFMGGFGASPAPASGSSSIVPMTDAAGEVSATSPKVAASGSGNVYDDFIGGVKSAGLTNPYGLAAVAATGQAESGWSPQNANRSWSDPSQSGQAGTAGGVMSWRNERLNNLYNFARQRGEEPGNISPATQAAFFVQEDPSLIQALNGAKSAEEAQRLMNGAWKFAGYEKPGGETARRMGLASSYLPRFQGGDTEVASLDPSAGMSASQAIDVAAAPSGYVDPMVSAPNSRGAVANALMSSQQSAQTSPPGELSSTTNAARQPYQGVTVAQALGNGPNIQQAFKLLNNPYATDADKAMATAVIEQAQKRNDPSYQLEQDYRRAQLEALRAKPEDPWEKLDDGRLFRKRTGEIKEVASDTGGNGQFRFKGNAVDAQALNGLMDAGKLTPDQAQQIAAGKTVTGPNGEIIFMTPQGVFGQSTDGTLSPMSAPQPPQPPAAPQAPANGVDIFGGDAPATPTPPAPPSPPQAPQRPGMIPLTSGDGLDDKGRQRRQMAIEAGLDPESDEGKRYILTGTLPASDKGVTAGDRQAIREADDLVQSGETTLGLLARAMELSPQANEGWAAGTRSWLGANLPDSVVPDAVSSPQSGRATLEYNNIIKEQALTQLKSIFGGNPTEGERQILLDIQGLASQPKPVRENILRRAEDLVRRKVAYSRDRAEELRSGTYYKPKDGQAKPSAPNIDDLMKKYGGQ